MEAAVCRLSRGVESPCCRCPSEAKADCMLKREVLKFHLASLVCLDSRGFPCLVSLASVDADCRALQLSEAACLIAAQDVFYRAAWQQGGGF